jgi:hypothetical protein
MNKISSSGKFEANIRISLFGGNLCPPVGDTFAPISTNYILVSLARRHETQVSSIQNHNTAKFT